MLTKDVYMFVVIIIRVYMYVDLFLGDSLQMKFEVLVYCLVSSLLDWTIKVLYFTTI